MPVLAKVDTRYAAWISWTLSCFFFAARLYARLSTRPTTIGADDCMLSLALILFLAQAIIGHEAWQMFFINKGSADSPTLAVMFWASRLLWVQVVWLSDLSLVLLYRRLLAGLYMKNQLKAVLVLVLVCWAIVFLVNVFPFRSFTAGDPFDRARYTQAEVVHYWMAIYITGPLNVTVGIILVLLPFPLVRKLRLSSRDKTALIIIFSIGAFKICASLLSWLMVALEPASNRHVFWKYIEEGAMIIVQSLMVLRPLFHDIINVFSSRSTIDTKRSSVASRIVTSPEEPDQARLRLERRQRRFGSRSIEQLELVDFITDKRNLLRRSYIETMSESPADSKADLETVISEVDIQRDPIMAVGQVPIDNPTDQQSNSPWTAIQVQNTFEQSFDNRSRSDILQFSKSEISTGGMTQDQTRVPSKARHAAGGHNRLKSKISLANLRLMEPDSFSKCSIDATRPESHGRI